LLKAKKEDDPPFGGWLSTAEWRVKAFEGDWVLLLKKTAKANLITHVTHPRLRACRVAAECALRHREDVE
jgi:hypothetical protein